MENDLGDSVKLGLHARYGGYALVTGAARGIGRAFATYLAADGFDLLLVDREAAETTALGEALQAEHGIDARPLICDLAEADLAAKAQEWARTYEIGLLVNNAGISVLDPFFDISLDAHLATLDLNCRATLVLTHVVGKAMASRGRGGIIIVSSASGLSGSPYFSHYAATKGYGLNLACGLWSDQGLGEALPFYIPLTGPEPVALGALRGLGKQPALVPAWADRMSAGLLSKLLPRSWTLSLMKRSIEKMRD